jgi:hypothetical protein
MAVIGLLGADLAFEHNIPQAFLASAPGHPLWLEVLRAVAALAAAGAASDGQGAMVEELTGPVLFKAVVARHLGLLEPPPPPAQESGHHQARGHSAPSAASWLAAHAARAGGGKRSAAAALAWVRAAAHTPIAPSVRRLPAGEAGTPGSGYAPQQQASARAGSGTGLPLGSPAGPPALPCSISTAVTGGGGGGVVVLPPGAIYPYNWRLARSDFGDSTRASAATRALHAACSAWSNPKFDQGRCRRLAAGPGAFAITYCELGSRVRRSKS